MEAARAMYGISAVERMTGVSATMIRAWQERYGIADPIIGPSGEVLYSRDDVENLLRFARSVEQASTTGPQQDDDAGPDSPEVKRLLILLAERDPYAAELAEYFLRTEGYAVETVFDTEAAERRAKQVKPDLAIIELLINGGEGLELCRRLHEQRGCPVIGISALDLSQHPDLTTVDAFLPKPVSPLELVSTVKDLLGTSALVRGPDS